MSLSRDERLGPGKLRCAASMTLVAKDSTGALKRYRKGVYDETHHSRFGFRCSDCGCAGGVVRMELQRRGCGCQHTRSVDLRRPACGRTRSAHWFRMAAEGR